METFFNTISDLEIWYEIPHLIIHPYCQLSRRQRVSFQKELNLMAKQDFLSLTKTKLDI